METLENKSVQWHTLELNKNVLSLPFDNEADALMTKNSDITYLDNQFICQSKNGTDLSANIYALQMEATSSGKLGFSSFYVVFKDLLYCRESLRDVAHLLDAIEKENN